MPSSTYARSAAAYAVPIPVAATRSGTPSAATAGGTAADDGADEDIARFNAMATDATARHRCSRIEASHVPRGRHSQGNFRERVGFVKARRAARKRGCAGYGEAVAPEELP